MSSKSTIYGSWHRLEDSVSRHFVGVRHEYRLIDPTSSSRTFDSLQFSSKYWSTVLVHHLDQYWLMTARHLVDDLNHESAYDRGCLIFRSTLLPSGLNPATTQTHVPWTYPKIIIDFDEKIDCVLLPVDPDTAYLLCAKGSQPISVHGFAHACDVFEAYGLMGYPESAREQYHSDRDFVRNVTTLLPRPLLPVCKASEPPADLTRKVQRGFFGEVENMSGTCADKSYTLTELHGMSGGPLFGFRLVDNKIQYRLVGIQSHQYIGSPSIAVCRIPAGMF